MEKPKTPTPEEMAKIKKERTLSDAKLLKERAEYRKDGSLRLSDEQIEALDNKEKDV